MLIGEWAGADALAGSLEEQGIEVKRAPRHMSAPAGNEIEQIAASLVAWEELMSEDSPDAVLLASTSNAALAAAVVATRLQIAAVSLEDGAASRDHDLELNSRLIHQLADVTLTGEPGAVAAWLRDRVTA
jgi:UDP-N-acetylglucosamine 2-epimerase